MVHDAKAEIFVAIGSFLVAAVLAFIGQQLAENGDIEGGTLMMCAQFLTLTATIFGIDYKIKSYGHNRKTDTGSTVDDK
ncbi:MAG: hypothetical protein J5965_25715 [Aeriscardovia sp.]|nr:hypothetical protein [Aeriscardovia sp.]